MPQLWYNSDEVNDFHPHVQEALNRALIACGFDDISEVIHHPAIPNSKIVPDFAIRLRASNRYIFIVEVKRTQRDVESQRYQNQTRSYVTDTGAHWEPNYQKYFCITNIERLILFADRQGVPLTSCILKNNPRQHSLFNPDDHDATASIAELQTTFEAIFPLIFNFVAPEWDNNWELVIQSFHDNYIALKNTLGYPEAVRKELTLYELFRLLAYAYLKDYYTQIRSGNAAHFHTYPPNAAPLNRFKNSLANTYETIIRLDFRQIFSNHPNRLQRLFPENFSIDYLTYFRDLIQCFVLHNSNAVADNSSPSYVFNLLTSKIYDREELHLKGKIMSDAELSSLLSALCIDSPDDMVLDPGCGDGALLDAAYDQINLLSMSANNAKTHNQILSQIDGIEIDPFLSQLSAFRLLSKNLAQVDNHTEVNILMGDVFLNPRVDLYDAVVMNPPFLRNDDPNTPITIGDKTRMVGAITNQGLDCFVTKASQPNLYFYFTNFIWHYLKDDGRAGIILMAKFLNNKDGRFLKEFISDKVESIISYPRKYFQEFVVTTLIVILKKGNNSPNVSFLRVVDENVLLNPDEIKAILRIQGNRQTPDYKLQVVPRNTLDPAQNWRQYLQDQKFDSFLALPFMVGIEHHFATVKRGNAENDGGAKLIFPSVDKATQNYFGNGIKPAEARIDIPVSLNTYISFGLKNNDVKRNYLFQRADILIDPAFHFPSKSDTTTNNLLPRALQVDGDLNGFYTSCAADFGLDKWQQIINNAVNHTVNPKIIIPRADRTKHCVYFNPLNLNLTLSTNFFYCNNLRNQNVNVTDEQQYKFTTAFLLSSFGQIQFELNANNQEGLRKLEGFHIKRFKILDLTSFSQPEINAVVTEFDALNIANLVFSGDEGLATPRRNLDIAIASIIFSKNNLGFADEVDMVNYFELFLAELVEDRRI